MKRTSTFRRSVAATLAAGLLLIAGPAPADEYDPQEAGHPLRMIAYMLHPIGVVLELLFVRPAHCLGSHETFARLFGHELYDD